MSAQISVDYNTRGDQAFREKEYHTALSWYGEGLDSCDPYSIQKFVEIWMTQPAMREGMSPVMQICYDCLKLSAEAGKPEAMASLRDFYAEGIGIEKDSVRASYWYREYGISRGILVDVSDITDALSATKVPRKSLLSNRFYSFLAYTYTPTMPYGFTAGIYFDRIGGYVSYRTDFKSTSAAYECNNIKVPAIEVMNPLYEFNRESWQSRMITGGLLFPVIKNRLFVSIGGGYGKRDYYREIISNEPFSTGNKSEWCYNTEASYEGLTLETGGVFIWKKLIVLGGVNSTQFKDLDVYIGLGLTF